MSKSHLVIGHGGLDFPNGYLEYMKNVDPKEVQLSDKTNQFFQMNSQDTRKKECCAIKTKI